MWEERERRKKEKRRRGDEDKRGEREDGGWGYPGVLILTYYSPHRPHHLPHELSLPLFSMWAPGEHLDPGYGSWFTSLLKAHSS